MPTEIITALLGLIGVIVGAVPTYLFMRQKNIAEVEKLKAETDKIKAEAEKIRAELRSEKVTTDLKIRILFVAANPISTTRLRLDEEVRGIRESLRKSSKGNMFELDQLWSVRWDDLRSHLLRHTPDILHIAGHGTEKGIVLEDEKGDAYVVSAETLNSLLTLFSDKIRLVVINTTYSAGMCKALAQSVDFAIGSGGPLNDKTASKFSVALYEALADGKDIKAAFEFARASIEDKDFIEQARYQLFTFRRRPEEYRLIQQ
ncbi:MAG: CHAT domain-containing protein [Candidatus Methanosuratincola sp.]